MSIPEWPDNMKKLQEKRLPVSPESIILLKGVKKQFKEIQKEMPEINGMAFFGSRTVGIEKEHSDLDCVLFYDGSKYWFNTEPKYKYNPETRENLPTGEFWRKNADECAMYSKIKSVFYTHYFSGKNSNITYQIANILDISKDGIDEKMSKFIHLINNEGIRFKAISQMGHLNSAAWEMIAPFLFGIGDGLYKARKYILDILEKREDGEKIWHKMVTFISHVERDNKTKKRGPLPPFKEYPKTIAESRAFFFTRE
jgi:hypothetical protein